MKDKSALQKLEKNLSRFLKEAADPQAQYALGYRRGQDNYHDKNLQQDFTGYTDFFKKGYVAGVKDAKFGKFNSVITRILTNLGDFLGQWSIGNRSKKY